MVKPKNRVVEDLTIPIGRVEFIHWDLLFGVVMNTQSGELEYLNVIILSVKIVDKVVEIYKLIIRKRFSSFFKSS
jgi:hypothetical protein